MGIAARNEIDEYNQLVYLAVASFTLFPNCIVQARNAAVPDTVCMWVANPCTHANSSDWLHMRFRPARLNNSVAASPCSYPRRQQIHLVEQTKLKSSSHIGSLPRALS